MQFLNSSQIIDIFYCAEVQHSKSAHCLQIEAPDSFIIYCTWISNYIYIHIITAIKH